MPIHIQMIECTWDCQKYHSITMGHVQKHGNMIAYIIWYLHNIPRHCEEYHGIVTGTNSYS